MTIIEIKDSLEKLEELIPSLKHMNSEVLHDYRFKFIVKTVSNMADCILLLKDKIDKLEKGVK